MTPSAQPKLPTWIFIVTDLALLGAAGFIATHSTRPFSETTTFAIVACVIAGAIVGLVPLVARYEIQKNETLDDRQRALEALARTISSAAEQISIAANGLHEIGELAQKNLRHAEKLPHQLQDKIAEFQAQLANVNDAEKEELEKEVAALRTTESERLDSISDKIAKSTAEWAKFEVAAQKRLTAAADTLAKAQAEAGTLETRLAATLAALEVKLAALEAVAKSVSAATVLSLSPTSAETTLPPSPPDTSSATDSPKAESAAHPPKRPRKPLREESVTDEPPANSAVSEPEAKPEVPFPATKPLPAPEPKFEEPPPIRIATIPKIAPVAPQSAEPFAGLIAGTSPAETSAAPAVEPAKPARKRASKKPTPEAADAALSLEITETPAVESAEVVERVRTSDGATRLLVTAYIGIGNRLFIRGEGPGLRWDKGVPLQFVSIGKWRWETNEASAPVKFKLYKNDDTECTALGMQSLDPGHQEEVTAAF
jgi:hypothetical protein